VQFPLWWLRRRVEPLKPKTPDSISNTTKIKSLIQHDSQVVGNIATVVTEPMVHSTKVITTASNLCRPILRGQVQLLRRRVIPRKEIVYMVLSKVNNLVVHNTAAVTDAMVYAIIVVMTANRNLTDKRKLPL
jgi:hypothetical protein